MKVPEPRKLSSGTWFIQLRLGGESVPISAATKKDCIRQAELVKSQHRSGVAEKRATTNKTVRDLMSEYIDSIRVTASPSTVRGYVCIMKNRFKGVSSMPARNVKDWQKVIDVECGLVSPKTLKNAWCFLCTALRAGGVSVPDVHLPQLVRPERPWLEPDEILRFVELLKGQSFEVPALLALHSLRRSEILAMTYADIDLSTNVISVRGSAVLSDDASLVFKQTNKTQSSRRRIPIMIPNLVRAIKSAPPHSPTDLIYPRHPNSLYTQINSFCRRNGFPEVGVHGLRHSFASLAYHLGLPEHHTMELGGWNDYNTMHSIYTHLAQKDRLKGQNKISDFFNSNSTSNFKNAN